LQQTSSSPKTLAIEIENAEKREAKIGKEERRWSERERNEI